MKNELIALLEPCGEDVPVDVSEAILRMGTAAVAPLVDILGDIELAQEDSPGEGYIPIHAARLLGRMGAHEAIEPMLRVLARCDPLDILYSELIHRLEELGPPVLEPALAALSIAANDDAREGIESVLAGLRVRDDRILRVLLARLAANVELGAILLGQYGDPAALPQLSAALDGCEPDPDGGILGCSDVVELEASISDLGGTLTPAQALKVQAVDALRDAVRRSLLEMQPAGSPPRRGQNPDRARKKARRMTRKKAQRRNRR